MILKNLLYNLSKLRNLRHVILVVGILMAGEHSRHLYTLYQRSESSIQAGLTGEGAVLVKEVRNVFKSARRFPPEQRQEFLDPKLAELAPHYGLTFAEVYDLTSKTSYRWGKTAAKTPTDLHDTSHRGKVRPLDGARYSMSWPPVALPLETVLQQQRRVPPPHEGRQPPHVRPPNEQTPDALSVINGPPAHIPRTHPGRPMKEIILIEFEPQNTSQLQSRLNWTLALGIIGLAFMILGVFYAWWLIGHRERLQEELHKKRLLAMLGEMSAVISHELRNPLAAAMGQAELLEAYLDEESRAYDKARRINHELERLETLANDLLNFVNSGRVVLEEVDFQQTFTVIFQALENARLHVHYKGVMPLRIVCDPRMLGRAIDNIIDNALIISEPNQGMVDVTCSISHGQLHVLIEDEGPGLPEGVELFKPFVTTREKGTGLGLAIASEIISAHGGTIAAMNRTDRSGARFLVRVPLTLTPDEYASQEEYQS